MNEYQWNNILLNFVIFLIISQTDDGLDSGTESDDETGGPDEGKQIYELFLFINFWKKEKLNFS